MEKRSFFMVSVFLVFILVTSGVLCGQQVIDLDEVWGDMRVLGAEEGNDSGKAVAYGDINGDGFMDIIGAWLATPGDPPRTDAGETYLIAGGGAFITAHGLGGKSWIKEFSLLANDLNSFKAFGAVNSQGEVHLAIGDLDADGHDEIAAGQGEVHIGRSNY